MPQNQSVLATKNINSEVQIFDYTKHPSKPSNDGKSNPDLRLKGHETEGYGLAWSSLREGYILSGSDDSLVCLWDISSITKENNIISPLHIVKQHNSVVEDVAWHNHHDSYFASVGDDQQLFM